MAEAVASTVKLSRVGKRPVAVPKGVTVTLKDETVEVQGPKGKLSRAIPAGTAITREGDELSVSSSAAGRNAARLQGLTRALLASMVQGAASGYTKILELVGTGYRCELKGRMLHLSVGLSHPVAFELPEGLTATIPAESKGAALILECANKEVIGQFAATVRAVRPPEPYGGKGIRYRGEQIRRKAGKTGKGK